MGRAGGLLPALRFCFTALFSGFHWEAWTSAVGEHAGFVPASWTCVCDSRMTLAPAHLEDIRLSSVPAGLWRAEGCSGASVIASGFPRCLAGCQPQRKAVPPSCCRYSRAILAGALLVGTVPRWEPLPGALTSLPQLQATGAGGREEAEGWSERGRHMPEEGMGEARPGHRAPRGH